MLLSARLALNEDFCWSQTQQLQQSLGSGAQTLGALSKKTREIWLRNTRFLCVAAQAVFPTPFHGCL